MLSSQSQPEPLPKTKSSSGSNNEEQSIWKCWGLTHPELMREDHSSVVMNDKIVVLNGVLIRDESESEIDRKAAQNIVVVDPRTHNITIIPPIGSAVEQLCNVRSSASYWKDSKIVVCGGLKGIRGQKQETVGIITLKDLDSESTI